MTQEVHFPGCGTERKVIQAYLEDLGFQEFYLKQLLRNLLAELKCDCAEEEDLIGNTSNERFYPAYNKAWEQPLLKDKLLERLGDGNRHFEILIRRISETLVGQVKKHNTLQDRWANSVWTSIQKSS